MNASLLEDYRLAAHAQMLRAEAVTGGYAAESASYFGSDGEGDAVERRVQLRDFMKYESDRKAHDAASAAEWQDARDPWQQQTESANAWEHAESIGDPAEGLDLHVLWRPDLEELVSAGSLLAKSELARRAARRKARKLAKSA